MAYPTKLKDMREEYKKKEEYLNTYIGEPIPQMEFYRDLFPEGSFRQDATKSNDGMANGVFRYQTSEIDYKIALERLSEQNQQAKQDGDEKKMYEISVKMLDLDEKFNAGFFAKRGKPITSGKFYPQIVHDDLSEIKISSKSRKAIMAPIGYFGTSNRNRYAHSLFSIVIDLDEVTVENLSDLLYQIEKDILPKPTYIVNSGRGFHLYYHLEKPIPCYTHLQSQITDFKNALCRKIWNKYTSSKEKKDNQPFGQGYRMVGTASKLGSKYKVTAYRYGDRTTIEELYGYLGEIEKRDVPLPNLEKYQSTMTLEEAKEKYPRWYETKVLGKKSKFNRVPWDFNRGVYDSWLERIKGGAFDGNRYNCIKVLFATAFKCGIPFEEVSNDAYSLLSFLDGCTRSETNHFTEQDIKDASETYHENYRNLSIKSIEEMTKIQLPRNKRNPRYNKEGETQQETHLKLARGKRDILDPDGNWRNKDGRPKKKEIIRQYLQENPDANNSQIAQALNISRTTVVKWVSEIKKEH